MANSVNNGLIAYSRWVLNGYFFFLPASRLAHFPLVQDG